MKNISEGLIGNDIDLRILTIETEKHPFDRSAVPESVSSKATIDSVFVDTKLNFIDAFSNLITSDSYNVSRFFTPDVDIQLTKILQREKFDVIHLESLFVTPYIGTIRRNSNARIVLRSHNLEYMIWERLAAKAGKRARKMYLNILAKQLKRYELATINDIDGIVSISYEDEEKYRNINPRKPILNVPFGININEYKTADKVKSNEFFHLGSLSWKPNLEGVQWFLKNVWPKYIDKQPDAVFHLAGRDIPDSIYQLKLKGLNIVGEVPDAKEFISSHGVMIVPLRAAGGIRVKIIEGMALGVPVLSTDVGAEGINCTTGHDVIIANTADEFIEEMLKCDSTPYLESVGRNARVLVEKDHNSYNLSQELISYYKELVK